MAYVPGDGAAGFGPNPVARPFMETRSTQVRSHARLLSVPLACVILAGVASPDARGITEPKTGISFADSIVVQPGPTLLTAAGVGLREKTFLKVDVYAIALYVSANTMLEPPLDRALIDSPVAKRLELAMCRDVERDKLVGSMLPIMAKNWPDTASVSTELREFLCLFTRDALQNDRLSFTWHPTNGLQVHINGELVGTIESFDFTRALWSVWFGEDPADKSIKQDLLAGIRTP